MFYKIKKVNEKDEVSYLSKIGWDKDKELIAEFQSDPFEALSHEDIQVIKAFRDLIFKETPIRNIEIIQDKL